MLELVASQQQRQFGLAKRDTLPRYCLDCDVRFACHGGCPKDRFIPTPDGEPGLNYLCAGFKEFFHHVDRPMRTMAGLLAQNRAPVRDHAPLRRRGRQARPQRALHMRLRPQVEALPRRSCPARRPPDATSSCSTGRAVTMTSLTTTQPGRQAPDRSRWQSLVRTAAAVRSTDPASVESALRDLGGRRRWLAPLAYAAGTIAVVFDGVLLLLRNWRLSLLQLLPAAWIWGMTWNLKNHTLANPGVSTSISILVAVGVLFTAQIAYWCNATFAYTIAQGTTTDFRAAFARPDRTGASSAAWPSDRRPASGNLALIRTHSPGRSRSRCSSCSWCRCTCSSRFPPGSSASARREPDASARSRA